ncbi:cytochrome b-245 light chain [Acrasis kona]|uniref:Cytochrome b-245 light chain n=1 Tax=Acrasis kona TaxID=1008807 RepID=A0AAW2ZA94_9EUKA
MSDSELPVRHLGTYTVQNQLASVPHVEITVKEPTAEGRSNSRFRSTTERGEKKKRCCTIDLEFGPYAKSVAQAAMYILVILGAITLGMSSRMANLGPGIYCFCVSIILYVHHFIEGFNKVDKSTDAILHNKGWNKYLCLVLNVIHHHAVSFIATLLLSGYLFTCVQTAMGGGVLVISSVLYLIALINGESIKPITGII